MTINSGALLQTLIIKKCSYQPDTKTLRNAKLIAIIYFIVPSFIYNLWVHLFQTDKKAALRRVLSNNFVVIQV